MTWARQLTRRRNVDSEDLVHEAYLAFTRETGAPEPVRNVNGFLFGTLRNLGRARQRVERRHPSLEELGLDPADRRTLPTEDLEIEEQLFQVARHAAARAEDSKTGSVLILRFFFGYAPHEIARIMRVAPRNVDDWLKLGRREARAAIACATPVRHSSGDREVPSSVVRPFPSQPDQHRHEPDAIRRLQTLLFARRHPRCLTRWRLRRLYRAGAPPIETTTLAQIATCMECLARVSNQLGLPTPADRHPVDALGATSRGKQLGRGVRFSKKSVTLLVLAAAAVALLGSTATAARLWERARVEIRRLLSKPEPTPSSWLPHVIQRRDDIALHTPMPPANHATAVEVRDLEPRLSPVEASLVELKLLRELFDLNAFLGQEVSFRRASSRIVVEGVVADASRRAQLASVVARSEDVAVVTLSMSTNESASTRQQAPKSIVSAEVTFSGDRIPVHDLLREYYLRSVDVQAAEAAEADLAVLRFSARILERSRRASRHAWAIRNIVARYPERAAAEVNGVEAAAIRLRLISSHATALGREIDAIVRELRPIFRATTPATGDWAVQFPDPTRREAPDEDLVARLIDLDRDRDRTVRAALAVSTDVSSGTGLDSDAFWSALFESIRLTSQLQHLNGSQ